MSQSEDKKDIKKTEVKEEQEETRLPVGELKWSKEQQEREQQEKEQQEKEKELTDKDSNEKKDNKENTSEKNSVHSEISATLLEVEKEQESHISSHDEKENQKDKKKDPLANIEDTLTPIDFKTYEFDAEQLKAIEQELNALNPQKLEEELHTISQQEHSHRPYNKFEDEVDDEENDELEDRSNNRWLKRTIWIVGLPALLVIVLFVSLIIGHAVVGGQPVGDIFDISMWIHVYNLIYS
ncbi:DNA-directed RNA polymerase subunit beta [Shimazuella alba]|uniref:DNA-directed RNA polymerase subunit beta n=1 Tax=Shimazuella alba TaxID=2690964 RepID=A0A6I4VSR6_9BACL|nr:DNA-directed RNA polymerase subunit beta [Shimazuella alba]MXQ52860.1 DNA-directed RNA polymerase subunit beta [Shimazuella alba]